MYQIFIVSDGTGRTAHQMIDAALTQYPQSKDTAVELRPHILTEEKVLAVLQEAVQSKGVIFHTIVSEELRNLLVREGKLQNVEIVDVMGPILACLSQFFAVSPAEKPGLFHQLNESYFRRIEAMEFAFRHDDGLRTEELHKAEIILVGVSRTFKTPLSIYLAFKGWFVANVPIILDINPPPELNDINPQKVIALHTKPLRLAELRKARESHLGNATGEYAHLDHVKKELHYAGQLFARHPKWRQITVTDKPIEEIASEIIKHFVGRENDVENSEES